MDLQMWRYAFWTVVGYLSGSVLYAYFLPKWIKHVDVTELSDDGNPGTANAFKYGGIPLGIVVIFCELLKGCFPVYLAAHRLGVEHWMFFLCMIAPVIGHAHSLFVPGKGGKAIAVSFGVLIGLYPIVAPLGILIFFYLFFSLVVVIQPHLFRSMVTFICYSIGCVLTLQEPVVVLGCLMMSVIVIAEHLRKYGGEKFSMSLFPLLRREKAEPEQTEMEQES